MATVCSIFCAFALKTEGTQIHFLSDVLVTVASLDLKSLITLKSPWGELVKLLYCAVTYDQQCHEFWQGMTLGQLLAKM